MSSDLHLSHVLYGNPLFFRQGYRILFTTWTLFYTYGNPLFFNKGTKSFLQLEHIDIFLYINKGSFLSLSLFYIAYGLKTNFKMLLTMVFFGGFFWDPRAKLYKVEDFKHPYVQLSKTLNVHTFNCLHRADSRGSIGLWIIYDLRNGHKGGA